ncbi:MAG: carbohydrate kinase family protein [Candidatus Scalindua sp.]|jgi:adenosine kinase|nr:carbohydrate kinase family protein [Candidatus Scalindua sp.]MBT5306225.1 carbohydrate kinase family protein [Candidatus Scalindua sp.]MBT6048848.1 carbohydrate kinase family protein [Candidatus Scalindua sp.]MBT6226755.1 carbohydrate kinase family protein [Candidatus Scalindua sp.]MBT6562381.1 carbohydrate kinase family protein [Candidatus Scalindua sp.]
MNILVSGSLAFDRIMDFPGKFSDHILPDKVHVLNVCFMINELKENFGGTAGNIAYALSQLGESPTIVATAGRDFDSYKEWFGKNNISTDNIKIIDDELTAGAYITTDQSDNQITAFNPGAMKFGASYDFETTAHNNTIAIVSPGNLDDMYNFSNIYKQKKIDYIFDPGQSLPAWSKEKLIEMIDGSKIFICNDYELQMTQEKTSMTIDDIMEKTETLVQTKSEHGSVVILKEHGQTKNIDIPAARVDSVKDPTGAGDAYRAGLIKGFFLSDNDIVHAAKMGAVTAAYCVEVYGPQNFSFNTESFNKRFEEAFGEKAF